MSWTGLLDRHLRKVLAANRRASAIASTDAFDRLKAIADEGIIPFCEKALGFTPTDYQTKFLLDTKQDVLGYLKLLTQERRVLFPYELDFLQELNAERLNSPSRGKSSSRIQKGPMTIGCGRLLSPSTRPRQHRIRS